MNNNEDDEIVIEGGECILGIMDSEGKVPETPAEWEAYNQEWRDFRQYGLDNKESVAMGDRFFEVTHEMPNPFDYVVVPNAVGHMLYKRETTKKNDGWTGHSLAGDLSKIAGRAFKEYFYNLVPGIEETINLLSQGGYTSRENSFDWNDGDQRAWLFVPALTADKYPDIWIGIATEDQNRNYLFFYKKPESDREFPEMHIRQIWEDPLQSEYFMDDIQESIEDLPQLDPRDLTRELIKLASSSGFDDYSDTFGNKYYHKPNYTAYEQTGFLVGDISKSCNGIRYCDLRDSGFVFSTSNMGECEVLDNKNVANALDTLGFLPFALKDE